MKPTTVFATVSFVILFPCFLVVGKPTALAEGGLQEHPINDQDLDAVGENISSKVEAPARAAPCEECEVEWWPPRFWTRYSKYSPVAESGGHHHAWITNARNAGSAASKLEQFPAELFPAVTRSSWFTRRSMLAMASGPRFTSRAWRS